MTTMATTSSATPVRVRYRMAEAFADLAPPVYSSDGAAGADLRAALAEPLVLVPGARWLVPTGL
ncbi:MAG: dUTP diphosphatase, partial [Thermoanaerobaculia bacterium]